MERFRKETLSDDDSENESNSDEPQNQREVVHLNEMNMKRSYGKRKSDNESVQTPNKRLKSENNYEQSTILPTYGQYSNASRRMMKNMGYTDNTGLGKGGQGIQKPIEASEQKGRRGLGLKLDGLDLAAVKWNPEIEVVSAVENIEWLVNEELDLQEYNRDLLDSWIVVGAKKLKIDDETKFVDAEVLREVLRSKSIFDNLGEDDMRTARTKSNPFETIQKNIFQNRAAVKMANIDSMFGFMFTNPIDENGGPLVRNDDLLFFADVCAGPGGFSEYVLWKKQWHAKGFGFTLRKENDFKLHEFYAGSPDTFDPYYGVKEDGNVFDPENIESFTNYVLKQTEIGVHFMMADGGFSVEGQENIQEILSKQLYLCQCIVALSIVRENGHFVCKFFDLFTPFSVGLIYLMYRCFKEICISKPNTSRPANSERYIVCKWKKPDTDTIQRHLMDINKAMWENPNAKVDTLELVPYDIIQKDEKFYNYIIESNNLIGRNQIIGLLKIAAFCKDTTLTEPRQGDLKKECLKLWQLPDLMRKAPPKTTIDQLSNDLLDKWVEQKDFLNAEEKCLTATKDLNNYFGVMYDWYFVAIDTIENCRKNVRTLFMSKGGRDVLGFNSNNSSWYSINTLHGISIEMSPKTLLYGEIVKELLGEGKSQTITYALHIIDGMVLGGTDIRSYPLKRRIEMCQKFAKALNKPKKYLSASSNSTTQEMTTPIRCKQIFRLQDLNLFFDRLDLYKIKENNKCRLGFKLRNDVEPDRFFVPHGLLFIKETKEQLLKMYSKKNQKFYYYDKLAKHTFYPDLISDPNMIYASFKSTFVARRLWKWEMETQVSENYRNDNTESELLFRTDFDEYIKQNLV